jgi:hypothetical protein
MSFASSSTARTAVDMNAGVALADGRGGRVPAVAVRGAGLRAADVAGARDGVIAPVAGGASHSQIANHPMWASTAAVSAVGECQSQGAAANRNDGRTNGLESRACAARWRRTNAIARWSAVNDAGSAESANTELRSRREGSAACVVHAGHE